MDVMRPVTTHTDERERSVKEGNCICDSLNERGDTVVRLCSSFYSHENVAAEITSHNKDKRLSGTHRHVQLLCGLSSWEKK